MLLQIGERCGVGSDGALVLVVGRLSRLLHLLHVRVELPELGLGVEVGGNLGLALVVDDGQHGLELRGALKHQLGHCCCCCCCLCCLCCCWWW